MKSLEETLTTSKGSFHARINDLLRVNGLGQIINKMALSYGFLDYILIVCQRLCVMWFFVGYAWGERLFTTSLTVHTSTTGSLVFNQLSQLNLGINNQLTQLYL
jgi:hypothetical protein